MNIMSNVALNRLLKYTIGAMFLVGMVACNKSAETSTNTAEPTPVAPKPAFWPAEEGTAAPTQDGQLDVGSACTAGEVDPCQRGSICYTDAESSLKIRNHDLEQGSLSQIAV